MVRAPFVVGAVVLWAVLAGCGGGENAGSLPETTAAPTVETVDPSSIGTVAPAEYAEARDSIYWGVTNMGKLTGVAVDDPCLKEAIAGLTPEQWDDVMPYVDSNRGISFLMQYDAFAACIDAS
jgi:hypothetical protein